ncbi:MAG: phosphate signaling complex protein PhoU [Parvibaculales bacterium]
MDQPKHISSNFENDLIDLNNEVARLGALAEGQLRRVIEIVKSGDVAELQELINQDKKLDEIEATLNEKAITMIALRAPLAEDLRHVIVALKVATILERTGDYAKNIAKRVMLIDEVDVLTDTARIIDTMGKMVQEMLVTILDAYMERNVEAAMEIWERDIEVDEVHTAIFKDVLTQMEKKEISVNTGSHMLFIAKNLERIGDYSTGLAEQIYFLVNGEMLSDDRPKLDTPA